MRVTSKGQVTIPKDIRDRLGIEAGSEVAFVQSDKGALLIKTHTNEADQKSAEFDDWAKAVKGQLDGVDGDSFVDWVRGARDDLDAR